MKKLKMILNVLILVGFLLIPLGFVYDVMFAGIPFQDPTPEMIQEYRYHSTISNWIIASGAIIFLASGVSRILVKIVQSIQNFFKKK